MVSQKYRGSCIGAALTKWLAKNTVASQKMTLKKKIKDGTLKMLLIATPIGIALSQNSKSKEASIQNR